MTHVIERIEEYFADTALVEVMESRFNKECWLQFVALFRKAFMNIAFAEAGEQLIE